MFKGNRKYYWVLGIVFSCIIVVQYMKPIPVNWRKTFLAKDKIPFGCYAIYNLMENTYAGKVDINKLSFYNLQEQNKPENTSVIIVNDQITFSRLDVKKMFEFISAGNKVCISANEFFELLADTFKIETTYDWAGYFKNMDSALKKTMFSIKYVNPKNNFVPYYSYPEAATETYFTSFDTSQFKVMAVNKNKSPILIRTSIGKGHLYINTMPDAFANIFIVDHVNRHYVYTLMTALKNKNILWDEHYKTYNPKNESMFKYIFESDPLYMAYSITILGLLFFMFFSIKRKQRAIAIIKPLENSTLEFVDVVSQVYFNSKNHRYIAIEKINYFYFDIRNKFYVNTNTLNEEFYIALNKLSGVQVEELKKLFEFCEALKKANALNEYDLIELNKRINDFKQKSIR